MIYNALVSCASGLLKAAHALPASLTGVGKSRRFVDGQARALRALAAGFEPGPENYWLHCSSLGEYAIARPLIAELKARRPEARILLTFFSPTGVDALRARPNPAVDFVGFLPPDTRSNAREFLALARPRAAIFAVSEYWPGYLRELRRRGIPAFLVSSMFGHDAPHFSALTGRPFRASLEAYAHIFCLTDKSVRALAELGFSRASVEGDPLVDNALKISSTPWHSPLLQEFAAQGRTLICGSIHDADDLRLVAAEVNAHPERRYLLVPHEVDESTLARVEQALDVPPVRLSAYAAGRPERVVIVDNVGSLAYLYRLGGMAYIGGGFGRQLHSLLEATVYGLPIAFGPRSERKAVARILLAAGVATTVSTPAEFRAWADRFFAMPAAELEELKARARALCERQAGATKRIIDRILSLTPDA